MPTRTLDGSRAWAVAAVLGVAQLCVLFDSLSVATALPAIGAHFDLEPAELQWVVSLFSISIGSFMLLGGRACDVLGARRVLAGSLALCALGGLLAGASPAIGVLLAGRVVQGLAAAAALPAALSLASSLFTREPWQSRVYSVIATAAWLAAIAGAVLGGLITDAWGWRWIFLVTVPAACSGCSGAARCPHRSRDGWVVEAWTSRAPCSRQPGWQPCCSGSNRSRTATRWSAAAPWRLPSSPWSGSPSWNAGRMTRSFHPGCCARAGWSGPAWRSVPTAPATRLSSWWAACSCRTSTDSARPAPACS